MKIFGLIHAAALILFLGCSKDKNLEDYQREQLVQKMTRINAVSGAFSGPVISKLDGTNLGFMKLKFQARTDIQSGTEQKLTVSGSVSFKSVNSFEAVFDNGFFDSDTGAFQANINVLQNNGSNSKIYLTGTVTDKKWIGSIEVIGQPDFGGDLNLDKNASPGNTSSIETRGTRLQQIAQTNLTYKGSVNVKGDQLQSTMTFKNLESMPEQIFYRLFSPVRTISVFVDATDFGLYFPDAVLDDKTGTIISKSAYDDRMSVIRANMNCARFDNSESDFGWDCEVKTQKMILEFHLKANL